MSADFDDVGRIIELTLKTSGFGHKTSQPVINTLHNYYNTVLRWNRRLHLTTIVDPQEFAKRHICESLEIESRIVNDARELWDIGSGIGIPGIPVAIVRPELPVVLVEAARKKAIYLEETSRELGLVNVRVLNQQFEPEMIPDGVVLAARAVEKMRTLIDALLRTRARQILVLGSSELFGPNANPQWQLSRTLLPGTKNSYLYNLHPNVPRGT
jgi:16S rRNA (guanine(527)-N(7))-methyltransferase RsmG